MKAWCAVSCQDPPVTLFIIHAKSPEDEYHDRYILSKEAGLSMGTSLNGLGRKESVVTILAPEDVNYVEESYVNDKLNIQAHFDRMTLFKLENE